MIRNHYYLSQEIPQLLELALPGIDPNDMIKTFSALSFFISFLSKIPLISDSGASNPDSTLVYSDLIDSIDPLFPQESDELVQRMELASSACEVIPDLAVLICDRLCNLVKHHIPIAKKGYMAGMEAGGIMV